MLQYFLILSSTKDYNKLMLHIFATYLHDLNRCNMDKVASQPKKNSSLDTNSKAGSPVKLCNFKTQHHHGSKTIVLDYKVEILDTEGPFNTKPISETNSSASLFAVHHGKERSFK